MKNIRKLHYTVYENTYLERIYCYHYHCMTIVIDKTKQCCSRIIDCNIDDKIEYMTQPKQKRKNLTKEEKEEILAIQDYRCKYCGRKFNTIYYDKKRKQTLNLLIHYDHKIPFSYSFNNKKYNMVAACNLCNSVKYNKVFDSIDLIREYINKKLDKKRYEFHEEIT